MAQLKGVGVALVTPFNEDLSVDFDSLTKNYQILESSRDSKAVTLMLKPKLASSIAKLEI